MNLKKVLGINQIFILSLLFILIPFSGVLIWYGADKIINETITITENNIKRKADKGLGTLENPYVIENRHIKTRQTYGMKIRDLSSYLVIQNCTFEARSVGLSIYSCYTGVGMSNTSLRMLRIRDNEFKDCTLRISSCFFLNFVNNSLNTNLYVVFDSCQYVTIVNNSFQNCKSYIHGWNFEFISNSFIHCPFVNLGGVGGENFTFCYNFLENSSLSLEISYCSIHHNTFQNSNSYAIMISYWDYGDNNKTFNSIHHNNFIDNIDPEGFSQAYDRAANNTWYDPNTLEGNYWRDYSGTGYYYIDGDAGAYDPYPLLTPVEI